MKQPDLEYNGFSDEITWSTRRKKPKLMTKKAAKIFLITGKSLEGMCGTDSI